MLPRIAMMRALHHRLPKPASEWWPRCAVTDLPDGQIKRLPDYSHVQPFREKYFASPFARSSFIDSSRPARKRGVGHRHERWAGCNGRFWCARRMHNERTAKSCGPDAPTLASSFAEVSARRRWQESPVTGYSIHTF